MEELKQQSISLKAARINAGLSQEEAAKRLHKTPAQISYLERRPGKVTLETAWEMSKLYNIPVWALAP